LKIKAVHKDKSCAYGRDESRPLTRRAVQLPGRDESRPYEVCHVFTRKDSRRTFRISYGELLPRDFSVTAPFTSLFIDLNQPALQTVAGTPPYEENSFYKNRRCLEDTGDPILWKSISADTIQHR
jgi:hypothetical protein